MFKKGTKLYSIANNKCPRCQEGDFFVEKSFLKFGNLLKLHEKCSNCHLKYSMEPSFYYGAMYVNYGLTVGLSIITFLVAKLLFDFTLLHSFFAIVFMLVLLTPINMRLSRIIWINIFVNYQQD